MNFQYKCVNCGGTAIQDFIYCETCKEVLCQSMQKHIESYELDMKRIRESRRQQEKRMVKIVK